MLSLSYQHIIFIECFPPYIVLQVSICTFLIGDIRMLQPFLCHRQLYFLLLVSDLIFHLWLWTLIFHLLLESHLLLTFNMCLQSKSACLLFYCFIMCNVVNITCCIDMVSFRDTFHIVLCPQNKTFVDKVQKYFGSGNCCGKSTKKLAAFSFPSLTCLIFKVQCYFVQY